MISAFLLWSSSSFILSNSCLVTVSILPFPLTKGLTSFALCSNFFVVSAILSWSACSCTLLKSDLVTVTILPFPLTDGFTSLAFSSIFFVVSAILLWSSLSFIFSNSSLVTVTSPLPPLEGLGAGGASPPVPFLIKRPLNTFFFTTIRNTTFYL